MFTIDHFEDTSKWMEATAGTGAIQNRTVDSFEAVLLASGDRAALITPVRYNVSELADLRVRATRHCAVSGIALHPTEPDDPSRLGGTIAIWRDVAYGLIVWFGAAGAAVITDDPVPADEPAEMRITLERLATGEVQISFYYNGELLYQDTLSTWMGEDFYVQLGVFADRAGRVVTGTTLFTSAEYVPPLEVTVTPESATLQVGEEQTFTATVTGGEPPYSIDWIDNATGNIIGSGETFTFTATEEGNYEIYARATDSVGNVANSAIVPITVTAPPPPPTKYTLTVDSTPIQGIPFTIEKVG